MTELPGDQPTLLDGSGDDFASAVTSRTSSPWALRMGLLAVTAIIATAGGFAVTSAMGEPAGPETPEEAVTLLFGALEDEDLLGMTEVMLPSERASLVEPGLAIFSQLQRLGVVDQGADLDQVEYLDVTVEGLEVASTPVADGLVVVRTTGGAITIGGSGSVPWGERFGTGLGPWEEQPVSLTDDPVEIAVIEENGSWYVSLYYSIAETARREMGGAAPELGGGPAPVGAGTPSAAVESLMNSMIALDAQAVLTMLDPEEARVLYDYAYLFIDDLDTGIEGLGGGLDGANPTLTLEELEVSSTEVDGRTVATIESFVFSVGRPDGDLTASFDGDCVRIDAGESLKEEFCSHERHARLSAMGLGGFGEAALTGLTMVERDGRWYVSVVPSILFGVHDLLAAMEPADVDAFIERAGQFLTDPLGIAELGGLGGVGSELGSMGTPALGSPIAGDLGEDSAAPETEAWPIDASVVPEGAEAWGGDPSFSDLSFLIEFDSTEVIATDVHDGGGGFVRVITMPDDSHVAGAVQAAQENWGHKIVTDPDRMPTGVVMIEMGDGWAMYLYENYTITTYSSEDGALAERVLTRIGMTG